MLGLDTNTNTDGIKELLVSVRRNAKVVKGGRIFTFTALVVVGDGKGRIGIGTGKAREVSNAYQKALEAARRNMMYFELNGSTIYHKVVGYHAATKVILIPASEGTGLIAGGATMLALSVLGVKNILAKTVGSSNPYNVLRATIDALKKISSPEYIANKRGKSVEEIVGTEG